MIGSRKKKKKGIHQTRGSEGQITALNISTEWVDVEMMDHDEMDKIMDVTV
jgi:hypothetical protein